MRRTFVVALIAAVAATTAGDVGAATGERRLDRTVRGRPVGVAVRTVEAGGFLYRHRARDRRIPASNEKLLLSMALLETLGPDAEIMTRAAAAHLHGATVEGDLWILGRGDPTISTERYAKGLPIRATRMSRLARAIAATGIERITGRVVGSTSFFARDWWAPGWKRDFPREEVPLPTALTFNGNVHEGRHIPRPEERAARALTKRLRALGVSVRRRPAAGRPPRSLLPIAQVSSAPLRHLLRFTNRHSSNFFAEVLGKGLGALSSAPPGTIAKGAAAIERYARARGVGIAAHDSSGLSYGNRISPQGMTRLLLDADRRDWGDDLRRLLPGPGQGTLEDRLGGVRLRAKTGTLKDVSTLSGWVWLRRARRWAVFSIMSRVDKPAGAHLEDRIARILHRYAR